MRTQGSRIPRWWWLLLVGVTAAAYLPGLLNWMSTDEGHFTTMAEGPLLWGRPFYHVGYENKPPGVYVLYLAVRAVAGPGIWKVRLLWAGLALATSALMLLWLAQTGRPRVGLAAALAYPLLLGLVVTPNAYTEIPLALATTGAMYLAWQGMRSARPRGYWLGAGVAVGLAGLCKQIAAFDLLALGLVAVYGTRMLPWPRRWARLGAVLLGAAAVGGVAALLLAATGQLRECLYCVGTLTFAPDVAASGGEALAQLKRWLPLGLLTLPLWVGAGVAWRWLWQAEDSGMGRLLGIWLPLALAGAASSRMFGFHYAVQFLPALLLAGMPGLAWLAGRVRPLPLAAALVVLLALGAGTQGHRYRAVVERVGGGRPDPKAQLGHWLAESTAAEEPVYMVGWCPQVYAYAERRPASRWLWSFYVTVPGVTEEVLGDLAREQPRYVGFDDLRREADRQFAERVREYLRGAGYQPRQPGLYTRVELWTREAGTGPRHD